MSLHALSAANKFSSSFEFSDFDLHLTECCFYFFYREQCMPWHSRNIDHNWISDKFQSQRFSTNGLGRKMGENGFSLRIWDNIKKLDRHGNKSNSEIEIFNGF